MLLGVRPWGAWAERGRQGNAGLVQAGARPDTRFLRNVIGKLVT